MIHVSYYVCINCRRRFLRLGKQRSIPRLSDVETSDLFLAPEDDLTMDEVLQEIETAETAARFSAKRSED